MSKLTFDLNKLTVFMVFGNVVKSTRTGSGVCVQGITDQQNVRGAHMELYGSPGTLLMLCICLIPHTSSNDFQMYQ